LEACGIDPRPLFERAGIPYSALEEGRARFPKSRFEALWHAAREATGDPVIALRVSTMAKAATLGVIGHLASASESPRNAFEMVRGLTPLLWENVDCQLESDGDVALIRCLTGGGPEANRFTKEYAVGLAVTMSRTIGPSRLDPLEARFSFAAPPYAGAYERILGLPVRFAAGEDAVAFPAEMIDRSNPLADASLRQLLERYAAEQLAEIPTNASLSERVRAHVLARLSSGRLSAGRISKRLGMSERTLRRRLRAENTTFQRILDDVRAELARRYLGREGRAIDEVSFLLGFSDQSAFTKAFRRWTGRTPGAFVRSRRPG
ncbi:MAG: AraC family transcriptional regulator, partial [Deltaproteobacteria bacterium]